MTSAIPWLFLLLLLSRRRELPRPQFPVPRVTLPPHPPPPIAPPPEVVVSPLPFEPITPIEVIHPAPFPLRPGPGVPPFVPPHGRPPFGFGFPLPTFTTMPAPERQRPRPRSSAPPGFRPPPMDSIQPPPEVLHPFPVDDSPPSIPVILPPVAPGEPPIVVTEPAEPVRQVVVVRQGEGLSQVAQRLGRPGTRDDVRAIRAVNIPQGPDAEWSSTSSGNLARKGRKGGLQPGDMLYVPEGWIEPV